MPLLKARIIHGKRHQWSFSKARCFVCGDPGYLRTSKNIDIFRAVLCNKCLEGAECQCSPSKISSGLDIVTAIIKINDYEFYLGSHRFYDIIEFFFDFNFVYDDIEWSNLWINQLQQRS